MKLPRIAHLAAALLATCCALPAVAQQAHVLTLRVDDTIQPISQERIQRAVSSAAAEHADALVIQLNTPGGMLDSTREIVQSIQTSAVPVVVYVTPTGAHAASAGFYILESADIAAMAPGTQTGAAHPVLSNGGSGSDVMKQKMENDAAALLRSSVSHRDRNVSVAESAVLESKAFTAEEALNQHLVEVVAPDVPSLLQQVNGRNVKRFDGSTVAMHTWPAQITTLEPTTRENILDRLMDPDAAVLLLLLGALLIYVEFHIPGTIVPGAVGGLFLLTALFAMHLLPVRGASVALLAAAAILFLLELKFPSHGLLAITATVAMLIAMLTLVDGPIPELRVHPATAIALVLAFSAITTLLLRLAYRARKNKSLTGAAALVGHRAEARTSLAPAGQVFIHGELWQADSPVAVPRGATVVVRGFDGLLLHVTPIE